MAIRKTRKTVEFAGIPWNRKQDKVEGEILGVFCIYIEYRRTRVYSLREKSGRVTWGFYGRSSVLFIRRPLGTACRAEHRPRSSKIESFEWQVVFLSNIQPTLSPARSSDPREFPFETVNRAVNTGADASRGHKVRVHFNC